MTSDQRPATSDQRPATSDQALTDFGFSPDAMSERKEHLLDLLRQAAPEIISDNQLDLERLKALLGEERLALAEHYELNWAGKSAARREIQKTTSHTLRPSADNPERAPHMLIEGENLEVLRVLQKSYYGKVKMIYIDPPYNTGNDSFVYPDDYSETLDEYQRRTGEKNEAGFLNKQSLWKKNSKESGQYHSAWLSMMYPRLYLARNLLRDDGVIFISIDDNEAANLKLLCDEVFGGENFVSEISWRRRSNQPNDKSKMIGKVSESVVVFARSSRSLRYGQSFYGLPFSEQRLADFKNPDGDPRGAWATNPWKAAVGRGGTKYVIRTPLGVEYDETWYGTRETFERYLSEGKVYWTDQGAGYPRIKIYLDEKSDGALANNFWSFQEFGSNQEASSESAELLGGKDIFDGPKPSRLIKMMSALVTKNEDVVLDFFAGSGTTAQAVMELNLDDGGNRQCICVQMPEVLDEQSEAYKAGYRTIADITRARIDKVIAKLKAEQPEKTAELACAHFTLAPSNFKVWRSDVADTAALRDQLALFQQAEKLDSRLRGNDERAEGNDAHAQTAMLTELLLKHGLGALGVQAISKPKALAGVTVHRVLMADDRPLWLCFDTYNEALKDEIVKARPAQVILLNSCFVGDRADEQLSNLQLELKGLDIGLLVI